MMPHHFKMLLVVLAFPVTFVLGTSLYQAYETHFQVPTISAADTTRIQYPNYHLVALSALKAFKSLSETQKARVKDNLRSNLVEFDTWLPAFTKRRHKLVCLGENHDDYTRQFLANEFFAQFKPDILMVETTPEELERMKESSRSYVPLLGANIAAVLKAQAAHTKLAGIEQTQLQKTPPDRNKKPDREQAIFRNFQSQFEAEKTNTILYGALHCGDFDGWLYQLLKNKTKLITPDEMTSIRVLGEHQDGSLEALTYFLDEIGLKMANFAITNTKSLSPWLYEAFPVFNDQTLKHYDTVVVFRP